MLKYGEIRRGDAHYEKTLYRPDILPGLDLITLKGVLSGCGRSRYFFTLPIQFTTTVMGGGGASLFAPGISATRKRFPSALGT
jgi:hypothetical protein